MFILKRTLVCALSMAIAFVLTADSLGDELTINGGFETGDTSGWTSFESGAQTFGVTNNANGGSFAGELFNLMETSGLVVKQANLGIGIVLPGEEITISFAAMGSGAIGGVGFAEFFSEIDGGGVSSAVILGGGPLTLTDTYEDFSFTVLAGPDVSGGVTLQFAAVTGADVGSSSRLFIDDVSVSVVRAVPEPASVTLLSLIGFTMLARRRR